MAEESRRVRVPLAAEPNPSLLLEDDGEGVGSLLASLSRLRSALDRERSEAPELLAELLAIPPLPQSLREERLRQDPRFHNWGLCELLVARGTGDEADPLEAGRLATLALEGADLVDRARHPQPVVEDLKARAWAAAGEAWLRQEDLPGAENALRAAAGCLAQGTGDLLVEARLLEFEALVRRQQGRAGEAAALLKMAAARYREIGESELLAKAVALRNEILSNKPAEPA